MNKLFYIVKKIVVKSYIEIQTTELQKNIYTQKQKQNF